MSPDLIDYCINQGWWPEELRDSFDFAYALNNPAAARHPTRAEERMNATLVGCKT
jgi:hypothetical protein